VSTVPFRAPTGAPSPASQASPDSLIGQLRATAAERREAETLTIDIPGRWAGKLRIVYGYVALEVIESYGDIDLAHTSNIGMTLDLLSKATRAVEAYDREEEKWTAISDAAGPVVFDDRFTRLLDWPRPDSDYEFSVRQVYEGMFNGNGLAIGQHVNEVGRWMGVFEEEVSSGEPSTSSGSTRSAPPLRSE